jgi:hypothetical protein
LVVQAGMGKCMLVLGRGKFSWGLTTYEKHHRHISAYISLAVDELALRQGRLSGCGWSHYACEVGGLCGRHWRSSL